MRKKLLGQSLVALALSGCATPIQIAYDAEVDRLCAADGGAKIVETIPWLKGDFNAYGRPITVKGKELSPERFGPNYRVNEKNQRIKGSDHSAEISRYSFEVFRVSDHMLMGSYISYSRVGGDIPLATPEGGLKHTCPPGAMYFSFIKNLFKPQ